MIMAGPGGGWDHRDAGDASARDQEKCGHGKDS
jgi:hypothetical protein